MLQFQILRECITFSHRKDIHYAIKTLNSAIIDFSVGHKWKNVICLYTQQAVCLATRLFYKIYLKC